MEGPTPDLSTSCSPCIGNGGAQNHQARALLVASICVSIPIIDNYLFTPLVELGHLSGPVWTHRSITHLLLAGALVVALFYYVGFWKSALISYSAHLP